MDAKHHVDQHAASWDEKPERVDLVVSSMVFHPIEDIRALLQKLHGALKPAGQLYVAGTNKERCFSLFLIGGHKRI